MIFPDWGTAPDTAPEEALPLFREWAVDWENGCFALRRGEPYLVSGDEALKIWVTRALRPESQRFRFIPVYYTNHDAGCHLFFAGGVNRYRG